VKGNIVLTPAAMSDLDGTLPAILQVIPEGDLIVAGFPPVMR
jgi:hypothetical protein